MAQITFTIPDAVMPRVLDAIAAKQGYTGTWPDGTAQTKAQFAKERIKQWIMSIVRAYEAEQAVAQAETTSFAKTDSEVTIT